MAKKQTDPFVFTKEMKKDYKLLIPNMATVQFKLLTTVLNKAGFNVEVLHNGGKQVADTGLKYVHNDTCYPALLVIGQMIDALNSGKYDLKKTALMISQTGGGCRASNYLYLLKKALVKAGYPNIPVMPLNFADILGGEGAKVSLFEYRKGLIATCYGDLLVLLRNQIRPYEIQKGESDKLLDSWVKRLQKMFYADKGYSMKEIRSNFKIIADDFAKIKVNRVPKVKVGIVGEIYVKFCPLGNNNLEDFLATQDCEVMMPGLLGFMMYCVENSIITYELYGGNKLAYGIYKLVDKYLTKIDMAMIDAVSAHPEFTAPSPFHEMKDMSNGIIGHGCKMGEGWLLTSEMVELCEKGYNNIICAQPFGCLPNHVCGKGMIRKISETHPNANIVPIDYDPGASRVNQENRIKLMLSIAKEQLDKQNTEISAEKELQTV